ncbi:hypothetical protein AAC387_Pa06g0738 [Persea americana]
MKIAPHKSKKAKEKRIMEVEESSKRKIRIPSIEMHGERECLQGPSKPSKVFDFIDVLKKKYGVEFW